MQLILVSLAVAAVNFPLSVLLARILGPESYGTYQFISRAAMLYASVATLGYPHALAWASAASTSPREDGSLVRLSLKASVVGGVMGMALGATVATLVGTSGEPWSWLVFGLFPLPNLISANLVNVFRGKLDARGIACIKLSQAVTWAGVLLIALPFGLSVTAAAIAMLCSQWVSSLCALVYARFVRRARPWRKVDDSSYYRRIRSFSYRVYPGLAVRDLNLYIDQILIGLILTKSQVGIYAVAVSVTMTLMLLAWPIANTIQPYVQRSSDPATACATALAASAVLQVAAVAVLVGAVGSLVPLLFGQEYSAAIAPARLLALAAGVEGFNASLYGCLLGVERPGHGSLSVSVGLAITVIGVLTTVPLWGIVAAAIVSVVAYTSVLLMQWVSLARSLEVGAWTFTGVVLRRVPAVVSTAIASLRRVLLAENVHPPGGDGS